MRSAVFQSLRRGAAGILMAGAFLWVLLPPGPGWSATPGLAEVEYREAAADFHRLRSSPAASPGNWRILARRFGSIHDAIPGTRRGADALYSAALSHREAWRASGEWRDLSKAASAFRSFVKRYPRDRLGDDSLMHLASMLSRGYHDPSLALETYRRLLAGYPQGDQAPAAKKKLAEIASVLAKQAGERKKKSKWMKAAPAPNPRPIPRTRLAKAGPNRPGSRAGVSPPARQKSVPSARGNRGNARIRTVEAFTAREWTRVVLTADEGAPFRLNRLAPEGGRGERIYFDLAGTAPAPSLPAVTPVGDGLLHRIRVSRFDSNTARVVLDLKTIGGYRVSEKTLPGMRKIIIELRPTREALARAPSAPVSPSVTGAVRASVASRDQSAGRASPARKAASSAKAASRKPAPAKAARRRSGKPPAPAPRTAKARPAREKPDSGSTVTRALARVPVRAAGNAGNPRRDAPRPAAAREADAKSTLAAVSPGIPPVGGPASTPVTPRIRSIMLDPGHGGRDPGAMGFGLREKDLTLEIAKRLRERLRRDYPELRVGMTRTDDRFIPLKDRPRLAKEFGADLFISVHLNANTIERFHGVETYFLNPTQDASALKVAARENDSTEQGASDLNLILADLLRDTTIVESSQLAKMLQTSLVGSLRNHTRRVRDLGVKQAPFLVLMGAEMPGVLVEAGFLTNRGENRRLRDGGYMNRIANGFYKGLRKYIETQEAVAARQSLGPLAFNR